MKGGAVACRLLVFAGVVAVVAAGVVLVLGVSGAGGAAGSAQARWVITDLGTLGGKESGANQRGARREAPAGLGGLEAL